MNDNDKNKIMNKCSVEVAPQASTTVNYTGTSIESQHTDHETVGTQAVSLGNVTGLNKNPKKLAQQTFHRSMLITRARSSSTGSKSESDSNKSCPPEWQRVPTARSNKRMKPSQSPSPEAIKTTNKLSGLQVDLTEDED